MVPLSGAGLRFLGTPADLAQEPRQAGGVIADAQFALDDRRDAPLRPDGADESVRLSTKGQQNGDLRPLFRRQLGRGARWRPSVERLNATAVALTAHPLADSPIGHGAPTAKDAAGEIVSGPGRKLPFRCGERAGALRSERSTLAA